MTSPAGVRRAELIFALSLATDLGTGNPMEHALASALIGVHFGASLQLSNEQLRDVYYTALLRHVGCTAELDLTMPLLGDDPAAASQEWALLNPDRPLQMLQWMLKRVGSSQPLLGRLRVLSQLTALGQQQARAQCETGMILAESFGLPSALNKTLWFIYERWDGKSDPNRVEGEAIPLPMRVVQIVSDAEQFRDLSEMRNLVLCPRCGNANLIPPLDCVDGRGAVLQLSSP